METLPVEILEQILLNCSTPSFIQFTKTSKTLFDIAKQSKQALAHHIRQLPGSKDTIRDGSDANADLLLLIRQRATENLCGCHWTADLTQCMPLGATLNPIASWLGSSDLILSFHGHSDLRVYNLSNKGVLLKDRLHRPPGTRILKVVRTKDLISILEAWPTEDDTECTNNASDFFETQKTEKLIPVNQLLLENGTQIEEENISTEEEDDDVVALPTLSAGATTYTYKLCFFDSESSKQLHSLDLDEETGYVPRDLAVHDMYNCAVLWEDAVAGAPTDWPIITSFTATDEDLYYNCEVIWPKSEQSATEVPSAVSTSRKSRMTKLETCRTVPARIAYFKNGQRLKIYEANGLVPREIMSLKSSIPADDEAVAFNASNVATFPSSAYRIETPFYGTHIQVTLDDGYGWERDMCFLHHLCLGVASFKRRNTDTTVHTLCILRSQRKAMADCCNHEVRLHDMPHIKTRNTTMVARLWGWSGDQCLTLAGSDRIATSPGGTRIAISAWNKIYVYSLNPKVLCDENVVDETDHERKQRKRKERRGQPYKQWERPVTDYYHRHKDPNFEDWNIVDLKPVVIDLEGAIAHQMCWTPMEAQLTDLDEAEVKSDEKLQPSPSEETQEGANSSGMETANPQQDTHGVTEPQKDVSDMESGMLETDLLIVPDTIVPQTSSGDNAIDKAAISPLGSEQGGTNGDEEGTPMFTPSPLSTTSSSPSLVAEPLGNMTDITSSLQTLSNSDEANVAVETSPRNGKGVELSTIPSPKQVSQEYSTCLSPTLPEHASGFDEAVATESSISVANVPDDQSSEITNGESNPPTATKAPSTPPTVAETTSTTIEEKASGSVHSAPQTPLGDCPVSQVSVATTISDTMNTSAKIPPRRKRITEDELVVLTDKGVQIWNFGARATGKRKKTLLGLEEGLHRNQSAWKGKGVATNNE